MSSAPQSTTIRFCGSCARASSVAMKALPTRYELAGSGRGRVVKKLAVMGRAKVR